MLLQTVPVTRFKVGAVGSEMRQGNNTKGQREFPFASKVNNLEAAGHGVAGARVAFSFSKRSRPLHCTSLPIHASTHDTLVDHGEVPESSRAMIGTKPECQLQREDFGWIRHCRPPLLQGRGG